MQRTVALRDGNIIRYELVRSHRRTMALRIDPDLKVTLVVPYFTSLKDADAAIIEKSGWIVKKTDQIKKIKDAKKRFQDIRDGSDILYGGTVRTLRIVRSGTKRLDVSEDSLVLYTRDPDAPRDDLRLRLYEKCREGVDERLGHYAPLISDDYGSVTIRDQKTRWGSCSSKRNLNFNYKLVMAPPECFDYVVIHELCHLIEFSHSKRFWKLVEEQQPDYRIWKDWLKRNGGILGI